MKHVTLVGLQLEPAHNVPVIVLGERDEPNRLLAMVVGPAEAAAIAIAVSGTEPSRPLTHDLLVDVIRTLGAEVSRAEISEQDDGSFLADLVVRDAEGREHRVDARPSDAIAVALRTDAPVLVDEQVLDAAGVLPPPAVDIDAEVDQFRAFLEEVDPEAFVAGPGGSDPLDGDGTPTHDDGATDDADADAE